jgi:hypothetical protein
LLGVVGVGGVGAYMLSKRKQRQNAMLQQKGLEILNATSNGTGTTTNGTTTTDGVQPTTYALNLENAQRIMSDIGWLLPRANKFTGQKYLTELNQKYADLEKLGFVYNVKTNRLEPIKGTASTPALDLVNAKRILSDIQWWKPRSIMGNKHPKIIELNAELSKLGYKLDAKNQLVKI